MTDSFDAFLQLEGAGDDRWTLDVPLGLCSGLHTLWGGVGLAAAVVAMERSAGRPCAWSAVQYVRPIRVGASLQIAVERGSRGRRLSQLQVTGRVDGEVAIAGQGSLGGAGELDLQFVRPPDDVPPPEDCAPRTMPVGLDFSGTLLERLEQRWAQAPRPVRRDGVPGSGRTRVWARLREPVETTRGMLAVLADFAPSAISEAIGEQAGGVSLDNTIRYARATPLDPGAWLLVDLTVEAVVHDVAQVSARLFAVDGTLLAVAGQSAAVRRFG